MCTFSILQAHSIRCLTCTSPKVETESIFNGIILKDVQFPHTKLRLVLFLSAQIPNRSHQPLCNMCNIVQSCSLWLISWSPLSLHPFHFILTNTFFFLLFFFLGKAALVPAALVPEQYTTFPLTNRRAWKLARKCDLGGKEEKKKTKYFY